MSALQRSAATRLRSLLRRGILVTLPAAVGSCVGGAYRSSAPEDPPTLRVMSYNIHYGDPDLARMAEVICASGAEVVGLQEVDVHWGERSAFADQATALAEACGMDHRFGPIYTLPPPEEDAPARQFGVAVLTRLPLVGWENHLLTRLSTQSAAGPEPMPGFLRVSVEKDGVPVDVFVTHLDFRPDPAVRRAQVAEMLTLMGAMERATVLLGDLNATPEREELAPLFQRMRDAGAAAAGGGFTFPGDAPTRRIDYVLVSGPVAVVSARVPATDASDHRPVVADLVLGRR